MDPLIGIMIIVNKDRLGSLDHGTYYGVQPFSSWTFGKFWRWCWPRQGPKITYFGLKHLATSPFPLAWATCDSWQVRDRHHE